MRVRTQVAMVMNLDKCIGCHTCSVTCKNVWTSKKGLEYIWYNNVESKPGVGYPKEYENQKRWKGGWKLKKNGKITLMQGGKLAMLSKLFANPNMPEIDDYYEPYAYNYEHLQQAPLLETAPTAQPVSIVTGERMDKINWSGNWEDDLGGEFASRSKDYNFKDIDKEEFAEFEKTFLMYLPRICEHCLNPSCVASCPSGALYKREEDGIVLVDQDRCRGWRMCVSGCPYKKVYFNWVSGKAEKCLFCYPRIEDGQPTVCSESCVGRLRYLGVLLYDADRIEQAASVKDEKDLYHSQLDVFLDPFDEEVIAQARRDGIAENWLEAAKRSPTYKLAVEWKVAFPLHPEYRTLPMVWYVPPLSPVRHGAESDASAMDGMIPQRESMRIPVKYLANLLTAGAEQPIIEALDRLIGMRVYMRKKMIEGVEDASIAEEVGLTKSQIEDMYRYLAIGNYEDRYVIPTNHQEMREYSYNEQRVTGFTFGNRTSDGMNSASLFNTKPTGRSVFVEPPQRLIKTEVKKAEPERQREEETQ